MRRAHAVDFLQEYRVGEGLHDTHIFEVAKAIAAELSVPFVDADKAAATKDAAKKLAHTKAALQSVEVELVSRPNEPALKGRRTQLIAAHAAQEAELRRAMQHEEANKRYSMIDLVLRVRLLRDASDINERIAAAMGNDVRYVPPPVVRCPSCRNEDETKFTTDSKSGDMTCTQCGTIVMEHTQFDGDWTRNFEGEEDTSSIGPAPNPLLSSRYNLKTGFALSRGVSKADLHRLRLMQELVEMQHADGTYTQEHRTRVGYKDKQKVLVFRQLDKAGERLRLAESTIARSHAIFSAFRDNREHVTRADDVVAACLIAAMEEAEYEARHAAALEALAASGGTLPVVAGADADAVASSSSDDAAAVSAAGVPDSVPPAMLIGAAAPYLPPSMPLPLPAPVLTLEAAIAATPAGAAAAAMAAAVSGPAETARRAERERLAAEGRQRRADAARARAMAALAAIKGKGASAAAVRGVRGGNGYEEDAGGDSDSEASPPRPEREDAVVPVFVAAMAADPAANTLTSEYHQSLLNDIAAAPFVNPDLDGREEYRAPS